MSNHCCLGSSAQISITFPHGVLQVPNYYLAPQHNVSTWPVPEYWHYARILGTVRPLAPGVTIAYAVADLVQEVRRGKKSRQGGNKKQVWIRHCYILLVGPFEYVFASDMVSLPIFCKDGDPRVIFSERFCCTLHGVKVCSPWLVQCARK